MQQARATRNPVQAVSDIIPPRVASFAASAARLAGSAIAVYIAVDETYDPTQVFATVLAIGVVATVAAALTGARHWAAGIGAGLLFFGGSMLWDVGGGIAILGLGALAGVAALVASYRDVRDVAPAVFGFFVGGGAAAAAVVAIILIVEG